MQRRISSFYHATAIASNTSLLCQRCQWIRLLFCHLKYLFISYWRHCCVLAHRSLPNMLCCNGMRSVFVMLRYLWLYHHPPTLHSNHANHLYHKRFLERPDLRDCCCNDVGWRRVCVWIVCAGYHNRIKAPDLKSMLVSHQKRKTIKIVGFNRYLTFWLIFIVSRALLLPLLSESSLTCVNECIGRGTFTLPVWIQKRCEVDWTREKYQFDTSTCDS